MRRNKQSALEEAKLYTTKKEMETKANSLYQYLYRNKMLDVACEHMECGRRKYIDEQIIKDAENYNTRFEWQKNSKNIYNAAKHIGLEFLDKCCEHMEELKHRWTKKEILEIASKYHSRVEFETNEPNCHAAARRKEILEIATSHMGYKNESWSEEKIFKIAKKYKTRTEFLRHNRKAYSASVRLGIHDKSCKHMEYEKLSFRDDIPAILYYISIDNGAYYKIGITNLTVKDRFMNEKQERIRVIMETKYSVGANALNEEKKILSKYRKYRIKDKVLQKGNTEIFSFDVLGLDIYPS